MKRYLGVDLHRTQFTVCTRLENGRTYLRQWPSREMKLCAAQLRKEDELAVEATGNTRLFYDAVEKHAARVVVVNPAQFKVISQSVKKTDKNDAELLAVYLSNDLLPEVRMKERNQRYMGHLRHSTPSSMVELRIFLRAQTAIPIFTMSASLRSRRFARRFSSFHRNSAKLSSFGNMTNSRIKRSPKSFSVQREL